MARRAAVTAGSPELTHVDAAGRLRMVDVGNKPITAREAVARGAITVSPAVQRLVRSGQLRKGNPLEAARLAGIMAAKRTSEIIEQCLAKRSRAAVVPIDDRESRRDRTVLQPLQ